MASDSRLVGLPCPRFVPNKVLFSSARGVVLIIGPWNYPFQLVLLPLIGAIAAGNCVVIKPSEVAVHTSKWLTNVVGGVLDRQRIKFIPGGVKETTLLLKQRWDYIFYTGNPTVGKIVMTAAAVHLTPVTLELGGKSPVIFDKCNLNVSVRRLVMGKFLNMGQTCVAPDYVFIPEELEAEFVTVFKNTLMEFFGDDLQRSPDLSRIINKHHVARLKGLLSAEPSSSILLGGRVDEQDLWVEPTLVKPQSGAPLLTEEIFGPILPIIIYKDLRSVISHINRLGQPLALYIFSDDSAFVDRIVQNTRSGAVVINETVSHASFRDLPFGGVGSSGFGRYYGKYSFDTFSHERPIVWRPTWKDPALRFPPYNDSSISIITRLARYTMPSMSTVGVTTAVAAASLFAARRIGFRGPRARL